MSSTMARPSRSTFSSVGIRSPEQGQHPEREGDVGRHGDAPTVGARAADVERQVEQRRDDHAAEGAAAGRPPPGARAAGRDQLALDLQADDEEEQRHQAVVDPVAEVLGDRVATDVERDLGVPQVA